MEKELKISSILNLRYQRLSSIFKYEECSWLEGRGLNAIDGIDDVTNILFI
jgi:hypothetical protein